MPRLHNKETGAYIGGISDADLQFLEDHLEEENRTDDDYFVDNDTIELLEEEGASSGLLQLLRTAVGASDGLEIRYVK